MKLIKQENKIYKITPAVCFSLLIHFAVAAFLILGLSNNLLSPAKLNGLNLVWISLDRESKPGGIETQNNSTGKSTRTLEKVAEKPANTGKLYAKTEVAQMPAATAAMKLNGTIAQANPSTSTVVKGQTNKTGVYGVEKTADKASNLDTAIAYPLYKENAPPAYPAIARVRGYEGIVLISAEVLPDGRVGDMKIRKSSGYAILDQSAVEAVKPWKFEPARKSGSPFTVWVDLPIKFILNNNSRS